MLIEFPVEHILGANFSLDYLYKCERLVENTNAEVHQNDGRKKCINEEDQMADRCVLDESLMEFLQQQKDAEEGQIC